MRADERKNTSRKGVAADRGLLSIASPMSRDLNPQKSWILPPYFPALLYPPLHFFISAPCALTDPAALSGHKPQKIAEKLKKRRPPPCGRQARILARSGFTGFTPSRLPWPTPAASWAGRS